MAFNKSICSRHHTLCAVATHISQRLKTNNHSLVHEKYPDAADICIYPTCINKHCILLHFLINSNINQTKASQASWLM